MPKLILYYNYLKSASPSYFANYMNCIITREGVGKIGNTYGFIPAAVMQKELLADILSKIEDADRMAQYPRNYRRRNSTIEKEQNKLYVGQSDLYSKNKSNLFSWTYIISIIFKIFSFFSLLQSLIALNISLSNAIELFSYCSDKR